MSSKTDLLEESTSNPKTDQQSERESAAHTVNFRHEQKIRPDNFTSSENVASPNGKSEQLVLGKSYRINVNNSQEKIVSSTRHLASPQASQYALRPDSKAPIESKSHNLTPVASLNTVNIEKLSFGSTQTMEKPVVIVHRVPIYQADCYRLLSN